MKLKPRVQIWMGVVHAKIQSPSFKTDRLIPGLRQQPYYYPAKNKKVVEWGRPGQMVRLTPHIIMDL